MGPTNNMGMAQEERTEITIFGIESSIEAPNFIEVSETAVN